MFRAFVVARRVDEIDATVERSDHGLESFRRVGRVHRTQTKFGDHQPCATKPSLLQHRRRLAYFGSFGPMTAKTSLAAFSASAFVMRFSRSATERIESDEREKTSSETRVPPLWNQAR